MLMRRLTHLVVLAAFVFSCGGQWYVLQGIAWIKMIHDYSQMVPLAQAVSMTFSGQYPCEICKAISEKQQSQDNKICSLEKFEKKFFPPVAAMSARPSVATIQFPSRDFFLRFRSEAPPTPPPRLSLA
jgi:hypothetical protein